MTEALAVSQDGAGTDGNQAREALARLRAEVAKVVVGQDAIVSGLVIALLCQGHVLLEGVPGVAKTLLVRTLGTALDLSTKRLQFTPDLMPGDVTGSLIFDTRTAAFQFREGPVFTNLLLADEINRTPPKTQAALLEVMEERQVSVEAIPGRCPTRSSSQPPRTRSSTRAPTRCPRRSWTGSCSSCRYRCPAGMRNWACCGRTTPASTCVTSPQPGSVRWPAPGIWPRDGRRYSGSASPTRYSRTSSTSAAPPAPRPHSNWVPPPAVPPR